MAYISPDAIENERGEQTYRAEIAVAGDSLPGTELSPGMQCSVECSVEVKTDSDRLLPTVAGRRAGSQPEGM